MTDPNVLSPFEQQMARLNPSQRRAVEATEGPVLILAGAGTGKTTVLTTRLAYIAHHKNCPLFHMLAVTFTNKAANQMKARLCHLLGDDTLSPPWMGTFHSIGLKIIRRHHDLLGLPGQFSIMDNDDQLRLLKKVIGNLGLDDKKYKPKTFAWAIQRLKDRALGPSQVTDIEARRLLEDSDRAGQLKTIYTAYQQMLFECGGADFGDLILLCIKLFREHGDVLARYQNLFRYILVDEYQDINVAQHLWLRQLAGEQPNLCCVGDDDQSIYSWRGAEVDHILGFDGHFENVTTIKLEDNYRSTSAILAAASHLIAHNRGRHGKTLKPASNVSGEAIWIKSTADDRSEARFIAHEIHGALSRGQNPNEIAILVRASFQTRPIEEALLSLNIPYRLVGGKRFYERLEIKDAVAYLKLVLQPKDNLALERAIMTPKRGIGDATLKKLYTYGREHGLSLWETCLETLASNKLNLGKSALFKLLVFIDQVKDWKSHAYEPPASIAERVLEESVYMQMWRDMRGEEASDRVANLKELLKTLQEFESLELFLEHVSLVTDLDTGDTSKSVSLMTLHTAKGLEFHTVFLPGWEEGLFPHKKAWEDNGAKGLEEERRLAYVGLTRAKRNAVITFARARSMYGGGRQPTEESSFLKELPDAHVRRDVPNKPFSEGVSRSSYHDSIPTYAPTRPMTLHFKDRGLSVGTQVMHKIYGTGVIKSLEGLNAVVHFETVGARHIRQRFLTKV
jgi:DNA helicase-2/ATP-dependent DNA helicase PcrA